MREVHTQMGLSSGVQAEVRIDILQSVFELDKGVRRFDEEGEQEWLTLPCFLRTSG